MAVWDPLIPNVPSATAKRRHELYAWKLFARRIQRHPFVKAILVQRDFGGGCKWCKRPFNSPDHVQVHHLDYDHACTYRRSVELIVPTASRPRRKYTGPDCRSCRHDRPDEFAACMSRLTLVHPMCNAHINEVAERRYASELEPPPEYP